MVRSRVLPEALDADPTDAKAWYNLGNQGGGTVKGKTWSEAECSWKALHAQRCTAQGAKGKALLKKTYSDTRLRLHGQRQHSLFQLAPLFFSKSW